MYFLYLQVTDKDKAEALLKMLVTKGPFAYKAFRHALEDTHQFLADKLDDTDMSEAFLTQGKLGV